MRVLQSPAFRRWSWLVIAALVVVSFVRAGTTDGSPRTDEDRVRAIAATLKCPTCRSQSVADSDSAAARAIKAEITRRVAEGQDADEIRAAIASRFGEDVQLVPGRSGWAGLVWVLPVAALVAGLAAVAAVLARWRRSPRTRASDEDRALVDAALARTRGDEPPEAR
ncbi:MAG TPA: cytochrome c-type biogenesis protein CcmH [Acidimicrobiales bacterium]|nr:cytochrome c-type biogenesis protein CcmH [Acidimicrobiales bacterium]